ncbi:MAG: immune inhibitor A [Chloroflexi bacterium]|nr:immune inhibitor A [Chloroflexota bacterium]
MPCLTAACKFFRLVIVAHGRFPSSCCSPACGLVQQPIPTPITTPPPASAYESLTAVATAAAPPRDMTDLSNRFQGSSTPNVAQIAATPYQVGDAAPFWVKDTAVNQTKQIQAELVYRSDALNLWAETGLNLKPADVAAAATRLENEILPTSRAFFGTEWQPGVDGDNRLNILHLKEISNIGVAYFWSGDEVVTAVNPYSNQRELLYVSLKDARLGSDNYYHAIAHELQHLIQWHIDPNEEGWLNEGLAELSAHVNGFTVNRAADFIYKTDTQLTTLSHDPEQIGAHYANAFYFAAYFLDRFGAAATQALVQQPASGPAGITAVLQTLDTSFTFDDLFADWAVANVLHSLGRGEGVYQYNSITFGAMNPQKFGEMPVAQTHSDTVHQYGTDYFNISSPDPVTVVFTGTQQVKLVDAAPYSGDYVYASLPADESEMTLTRAFDLTGLDQATLTFWTWYDIEAGWDYAYVAASVDDGRTWQLLATNSTTTDNPQGNSLGPGYTGISGGGDKPVWQQETADLTPFAGQEIRLRFHTITDGALTGQGFLVDDIAIPELGYLDDAEQPGQWTETGMLRLTNTLPQSFIVQRILIGFDGVQIERLPLDENQRAQWLFPMDRNHSEAILIVSGSTPVTRQTAPYQFAIIPEK